MILASFSNNKQGTTSVSKIIIILNKPCVKVNVGLVQLSDDEKGERGNEGEGAVACIASHDEQSERK